MEALSIQHADAVSISVLPSTLDAKALVIAEASEIAEVNDAFEADCAVQVVRKIKALQAQVERSRKEVKKPVLDLGRRIDSIADEFCVDLSAEASRIQALLNAHVERELRARAEIERQQREAARKAEEDRRHQEAEARRLEEEKRQAEAAAAAPFDAQEKEEAEAKLAELDARLTAHPPPPVPVSRPIAQPAPLPPAPAAKEVWHYKVTDIAALYATKPELVRLSENVSAIKAEINAGMRECPGIEIWSETVAKV